jgi:hypothetical protein
MFALWYVRALPAGRALGRLRAGTRAACDDPKLPLRHWTRERLFSWEARSGWLAPDLLPLDGAPPLG